MSKINVNYMAAAAMMASAMVLVATGVIASKIVAEGLHPLLAVPLRFLISTPVFCGLLLITGTPTPMPKPDELFIISLQAAAGSAGYSLLMILALRFTSSSDASVIHGLLPVLAALVSTLALRERLPLRLWAAILVSTAGALIVNAASVTGGEPAQGQVLGNLLVVAAVSGEALFAILNKKLKRSFPPLYLATLMSATSLALTLPFGLWVAFTQDYHIVGSAVMATVYISLFPTVLGFWLWYSGASRTSGGEASLFMAVLPIAALALSAVLLGETVTIWHLVGIILVLTGIFASIRAKRA